MTGLAYYQKLILGQISTTLNQKDPIKLIISIIIIFGAFGISLSLLFLGFYIWCTNADPQIKYIVKQPEVLAKESNELIIDLEKVPKSENLNLLEKLEMSALNELPPESVDDELSISPEKSILPAQNDVQITQLNETITILHKEIHVLQSLFQDAMQKKDVPKGAFSHY